MMSLDDVIKNASSLERARAQKVYCTRAQARAIALKTAQKSRVDLARPDVA